MAKQPKAVAPKPPALIEIEGASKNLSDLRDQLAKTVLMLKEGIKKVTDKHIDDLRTVGAQVGVAHQELLDIITAHPDLFEKPRSHAFHGITVGYRKGTGKLAYEDADKVIARIEKIDELRCQIDVLAPETRKLNHEALGQLSTRELKAIGISITDADDKPFIKVPADDVDKFANNIVGAYTKEGATA